MFGQIFTDCSLDKILIRDGSEYNHAFDSNDWAITDVQRELKNTKTLLRAVRSPVSRVLTLVGFLLAILLQTSIQTPHLHVHLFKHHRDR